MAHCIASLLEARLPTSCHLSNHASPLSPSQRRYQNGSVHASKTKVSCRVQTGTPFGPILLGFGHHRGGRVPACAASSDDSSAVGKGSTGSSAGGEGAPSLGGATAVAAKVLEPSGGSSGLLTISAKGDPAHIPAQATPYTQASVPLQHRPNIFYTLAKCGCVSCH